MLLILASSADSVSLRVGLKQTSSFDSSDSLEATEPELLLKCLKENVTKYLDILNLGFRDTYVTFSKNDKADVKTVDKPFIIHLNFLPGPRHRSRRIDVYFSTSQKHFSCCLTLLRYNRTKALFHAS